MGEVVRLQARVSHEIDKTGDIGQAPAEIPPVRITPLEGEVSTGQIETKSLYPLSQEVRPELAAAFTLLSEGLKHIANAINAETKGDRISSDDAVHRLQALLPELFCCRSISDGFGSIVSAVYQSLANMQGGFVNSGQLQALKKALSRIDTEPFLEFGEAVDEIMTLEEAGFEVEPLYYKYAADMLDE
jgi:hypothetical protein